MKYLILTTLLLSSLSNADNFFIEANLGYAFNDTDEFLLDSGQSLDADFGHPVKLNFQAGYEWQCISFNTVCKAAYMHNSSPLSGSPFNDEYDYSNDQVVLGIKVKFLERK